MKPIVIVSCGQKKRAEKCRADEMYIGPYHRACLAYARSLTDDGSIYILSARYGLLRLSDEIEPYEKRFQSHSDYAEFYELVRGQIAPLGLEHARPVVLAGRDYRDLCDSFWICESPLTGVGGIGKQIQWLTNKTASKEGI
jgi:hypothetical protein